MNYLHAINAKKKQFDDYMRKAAIDYSVNKQYQNVRKFKADNPPSSIRKQSINSVWSKYCHVRPGWAQYYWSKNGIASPYYIPSNIWFSRLCRKLNSLDRFGWPLFQDKNYLDMVFNGIRQPEIIVRNISGQYLDSEYNCISPTQATELCMDNQELIIKPSISSKHANGVEFFSGSDIYRDKILDLFQTKKSDFVIQRVIHQHHKMAELNPDSINTVRLLTLLWNGKATLLGSLVRVGVKGCRVDNPHASNGVSCVLSAEGKMIDTAYDRDWNPKTNLPNGKSPLGFQVPYYDQIVNTVKLLHFKIPHFRLVGWDMTVSEEGEPILIEANMDYPEIYFHQLGGGPIFADTDLFNEILSYVC